MVNELPTPLNTVVKLEDKSEPYEGTGKKKTMRKLWRLWKEPNTRICPKIVIRAIERQPWRQPEPLLLRYRKFYSIVNFVGFYNSKPSGNTIPFVKILFKLLWK